MLKHLLIEAQIPPHFVRRNDSVSTIYLSRFMFHVSFPSQMTINSLCGVLMYSAPEAVTRAVSSMPT